MLVLVDREGSQWVSHTDSRSSTSLSTPIDTRTARMAPRKQKSAAEIKAEMDRLAAALAVQEEADRQAAAAEAWRKAEAWAEAERKRERQETMAKKRAEATAESARRREGQREQRTQHENTAITLLYSNCLWLK